LSREVRELKRQVAALQELMNKRGDQGHSRSDRVGTSRPNQCGAESLPPLDPEGASRVPPPRQLPSDRDDPTNPRVH
jgi:hypothetical protein